MENITHVFRSTEFSDRDEQYNLILDMLNLRKPILNSYGKLSFQNAVLSKRKIKELIENNIVSGWDDPKLLTIQGLLNRGLHIEALQNFVSTTGFSKNCNDMTQEKMWMINKKFIDKLSSRFFALSNDNSNDLVLININNNKDNFKQIFKYIKNPSLGQRRLYYSDKVYLNKQDWNMINTNEEITLMNWGNAIKQNNDTLVLNLQGNFKTTKHKIIWLPHNKYVKVRIYYYKDINDPIEIKEFYGDYDLVNIKEKEYVQFMKMNYYMCTKSYDGEYIELVEI